MTIHSIETLNQTTPTLLSFKAVHSGRDITIQNLHASAYVYIGAENVSTTNYGFRINPDTAFSLELGSYDELWAVTSSNGSQVAVLSVNLE
jgi:hypothetical protein